MTWCVYDLDTATFKTETSAIDRKTNTVTEFSDAVKMLRLSMYFNQEWKTTKPNHNHHLIIHNPHNDIIRAIAENAATQDKLGDFSGGKPQAYHIDFPVCQHLETAYFHFNFPLRYLNSFDWLRCAAFISWFLNS